MDVNLVGIGIVRILVRDTIVGSAIFTQLQIHLIHW